jgi:UDP-N-acetylmuramoyl-L-alanyl-D-glutamate--2,6-diaminopimelate ligase
MTLADLLPAAPGAVLARGAGAREVRSVVDRHDEAGPDDVFVAVRGARVDGHDHVPALRCAAVVVEREVPTAEGVALVHVPNTRRALAPLAAASLGWPGRAVPTVAITGTNGKTTTSFLLAAIARSAGLVPGVVGTTGHYVGDERLPTEHTSPTAPVLQALLARMRDAGVGLCALEASSIGLAAHRCDAVPFRAAVFTNLTRDHLDWHGTMEAYAAAKARLFHELLDGTAVLNADDPASAHMRPAHRPVWTYSDRGPADLRGTLRAERWEGLEAEVETPRGRGRLHLPMVGRHNLQNALGALGAALAVGVPLDTALAGLATCPGAPGRLERVPHAGGFGVFVDYAHTDDALRRVLAELRRLGPRRIVCVFGCGGDRDRGKRPLMGAAVASGADFAVLTSDNPRSESPDAILQDVRPGLGTLPHLVEPDRRTAIHRAVALAEPGDVVLIAGKGHESWQEVAGVRHPFDDRAVAREALA